MWDAEELLCPCDRQLEGEELVQCGNCRRRFHHRCLDLDNLPEPSAVSSHAEELLFENPNLTPSPPKTWFCKVCQRHVPEVLAEKAKQHAPPPLVIPASILRGAPQSVVRPKAQLGNPAQAGDTEENPSTHLSTLTATAASPTGKGAAISRAGKDGQIRRLAGKVVDINPDGQLVIKAAVAVDPALAISNVPTIAAASLQHDDWLQAIIWDPDVSERRGLFVGSGLSSTPPPPNPVGATTTAARRPEAHHRRQ